MVTRGEKAGAATAKETVGGGGGGDEGLFLNGHNGSAREAFLDTKSQRRGSDAGGHRAERRSALRHRPATGRCHRT